MSAAKIDFEKFRLRPFVEKLIGMGEVEIHDEPVALANLSAIIEATPKATLFKKAGPQQYELVAAVLGSRRRMATAFGVDDKAVPTEYMRRMAMPQPVVEVASADAPVHAVIKTGDADRSFHPALSSRSTSSTAAPISPRRSTIRSIRPRGGAMSAAAA